MSEHNETDSDCPGDGWLSSWEKKCLDEWEKESVFEERLQVENEKTSQKIWQSFQNSATAVSRLFKDGSQGCISLWGPFQNAAGSVTILYRDCQESLRRSFELGVQVGVYRHTRDLLSWSKKRRRRIARDELIAHLCGKAVPVPRLRVSQSQFTKTPVKSTSTSTLGRFAAVDTVEPDLQLFHDALAVHGLSGAMSNVSVGRRVAAAGVADDCHGFLLEQMQHHSTTPRKRSHSATPTGPATPTAASAAAMDTSSPSPPSHKRCKLDDSLACPPDL